MINQQPNTEEIYKVLAEAKQYHREVLVKLIQADAPTQSLSASLEILQMLDIVGAKSSQSMDADRAKSIEERLWMLEEAVNAPRIMSERPIRVSAVGAAMRQCDY